MTTNSLIVSNHVGAVVAEEHVVDGYIRTNLNMGLTRVRAGAIGLITQ